MLLEVTVASCFCCQCTLSVSVVGWSSDWMMLNAVDLCCCVSSGFLMYQQTRRVIICSEFIAHWTVVVVACLVVRSLSLLKPAATNNVLLSVVSVCDYVLLFAELNSAIVTALWLWVHNLVRSQWSETCMISSHVVLFILFHFVHVFNLPHFCLWLTCPSVF